MMGRKRLIAGLACSVCVLLAAYLWASGQARNLPAHVSTSTASPQPPARAQMQQTDRPSSPTSTAVAVQAPCTPQAATATDSQIYPAPGQTMPYQVQPGDTLSGIALKFGLSPEDLIQFNHLSAPDVLYIGQQILIPGEGAATPTAMIAAGQPATPTAIIAASQPATPTLPAPGQVNGVPVDQLIAMSAEVEEHIQEIYAHGQALGNDPHAFSKIGDSNMENPYFLAPFDSAGYVLGRYAYLQPAINHFAGSFGRQSKAVRKGFHSWSVMDAALADQSVCQPGETPAACELRLHRPIIALIRLGTNDAGAPALLRDNLQALIELCIQQGVIPVLGTKADRVEGSEDTNNGVIRQLAAGNAIPLWDFDRVAQTMPGSGLGPDHVHLTVFSPLDYTSPQAFEHGHSVDNLAAVVVLDQVWRAASQKTN
jgi:LysM repeat protein